ncbi:MAG: FAD-dependent oxidoreductase [Actinobacteria bacterium]|nr:MAG: FAD-dependent oxidoreductase [Actinomycetota bacterium]
MGGADVAVVGAGILGLAAADALRRAGADVVGLERGEAGFGQSAGLTRSFRHIHDDQRLVELAKEARRGWKQWEAEAGGRLLGEEGVLEVPATDAHAGLLSAAELPAAFLEADRQRQCLSALAPFAERALLDIGGGALRARRAIETLVSWLGPRLIRAEVFGLRPTAQGAAVDCAEGTLRCSRVLVCAGAETARIASRLGVRIPLTVAAHARPMFRVRNGAGGGRACWIDDSGIHGETVYGSPVGSSDRYVVGLKGADADVALGEDSAYLPESNGLDGDVQRVVRYVERALPGLDPAPVGVRICLATQLPGGRDQFDVWREGPISFFAGHNAFKFAPALGERLAKAVTCDEPCALL